MTTTAPAVGADVAITIEAGLMHGPDGFRFVATAEPGTIGRYLGPHPNPRLGEDWHVVEVDNVELDGELVTLVAPLHLSHFEVRP